MAPEIAAGGPISKPDDVFSLGTALFHLATGIRPEHGMVLDPAVYGVVLPSVLRQPIVAMCHPDPSRRPTMQQIAGFLAQPSTKAQPPSSTAPAPSSGVLPAWHNALGVGLALVFGAAVLDSATKTWDGKTGRYRGSDGRFRGNGFFN